MSDRPSQLGQSAGSAAPQLSPQQLEASKRLQQTKAQVDEVCDIMRSNVERVLERDSKLTDLDDRAGVLQQGASQFEQQACKLKRKMWYQDFKMMAAMFSLIAIIVFYLVYRAV